MKSTPRHPDRAAPARKPRSRPAAERTARPNAANHAASAPAQRSESVGRRLRAELKQLVAACPAHARTSAGLARWLSVSRPVCHRMLAALGREGDGLDVLQAMPGHEGVEQVAKAAGARGVSRTIVSSALLAVAEYAEVIANAGGSQSKLLAQLPRFREDLSLQGRLAERGLGSRRAIHDAAAELLGIGCEACYVLHMLLPGGKQAPDMMQSLHAMAWLGVRARNAHFPLVASRATDVDGDKWRPTTLEYSRAEGFTPGAILGQFSSLPFPTINSVLIGNRLLQHIDLAGTRQLRSREGKDVVIGNRFVVSPPINLNGRRVHQVSVLPRIPTARLVLDIIVHRDLAARELVAKGAYYIGTEGIVIGDADRRWADRIEHPPQITRPAMGEAPKGVRLKHKELLASMLAHAGHAEQEFDAFRAAVDYPMQGWQYLNELVLQ